MQEEKITLSYCHYSLIIIRILLINYAIINFLIINIKVEVQIYIE